MYNGFVNDRDQNEINLSVVCDVVSGTCVGDFVLGGLVVKSVGCYEFCFDEVIKELVTPVCSHLASMISNVRFSGSLTKACVCIYSND